MHDHPRGFVDYDQIVIFINDLQMNVLGRCFYLSRILDADLVDFSRLNPCFAVSYDFAVKYDCTLQQ